METGFEQFANDALKEVATPKGMTIEAKDGALVFTMVKSPEEIIKDHTPKPELSYKDSWVIKAMQAYADQQVKAEREKVANEIQELKNKLNSQNIREIAHAKLNEMDQFMIKETEVIPAVVVKYYYVNHQAHAGAAFLKDVARYIESRNPALNEGKTWFQLMADFARKVDFDKTTRF